jgi:hypothetical protein
MADSSSCEISLVQLIGDTLAQGNAWDENTAFTTPLLTDSAISVKVDRGYPVGDEFDADLENPHLCNITVFPVPGMTRLTTRFQYEWRDLPAIDPTVTATASGSTVTIGGVVGAGQVVGVYFNGAGYAYRCLNTDTLAGIAAALAAKIDGATSSDAVLTVPGSPVFGQVVADQLQYKETRRQIQAYQITVWAPNPWVRDVVGSAISEMLADTRAIYFTDGSISNIPQYRGVWIDDQTEKVGVWKRVERYEIEYPTIKINSAPIVLFPSVNTEIPEWSASFDLTIHGQG